MGIKDLLKPKTGKVGIPPAGNLATQSAVPPNAVDEPLIPPLPSNLEQPDIPPLPDELQNDLPPMPEAPQPAAGDYGGPQFPELPEMPLAPGAHDEEMPEMGGFSSASPDVSEIQDLPPPPEFEEEGVAQPLPSYEPVTDEPELPPMPVAEEEPVAPPPVEEMQEPVMEQAPVQPVSHEDDLDAPPVPVFEGEEDNTPQSASENVEFVPDKLPPLDVEDVPAEPYIGGMSEAYKEEPAKLKAEIIEEEPISRAIRTPECLFVKASEHEECIRDIEEINILADQGEEKSLRLSEIKNLKDSTFEKFKKTMEDIERKLVFIDKTVFEG
ncbi:hypothetical protein HOB85_06785 [Candidatus Woesearchaeota archaeon]|nr:hypothetical protein [Candidatus Woesearchaeota archaeon]